MRVRILWLGVPLWSGCLSMNNVANIPGARGARRRAVSAHPLVEIYSHTVLLLYLHTISYFIALSGLRSLESRLSRVVI